MHVAKANHKCLIRNIWENPFTYDKLRCKLKMCEHMYRGYPSSLFGCSLSTAVQCDSLIINSGLLFSRVKLILEREGESLILKFLTKSDPMSFDAYPDPFNFW